MRLNSKYPLPFAAVLSVPARAARPAFVVPLKVPVVEAEVVVNNALDVPKLLPRENTETVRLVGELAAVSTLPVKDHNAGTGVTTNSRSSDAGL